MRAIHVPEKTMKVENIRQERREESERMQMSNLDVVSTIRSTRRSILVMTSKKLKRVV